VACEPACCAHLGRRNWQRLHLAGPAADLIGRQASRPASQLARPNRCNESPRGFSSAPIRHCERALRSGYQLSLKQTPLHLHLALALAHSAASRLAWPPLGRAERPEQPERRPSEGRPKRDDGPTERARAASRGSEQGGGSPYQVATIEPMR